MLKNSLVIAVSALLWAMPAKASDQTLATLKTPASLPQGSLRKVTFANPGDCIFLHATIAGRRVPFVMDPTNPSELVAFVGTERLAKTRDVVLRAVCLQEDASAHVGEKTLRITAVKWPLEHLKIPKEKTILTKEIIERTKTERQERKRVMQQSEPSPLWQRDFLKPVGGKITSTFGIRRTQNGKPRSPHTGVDFRAATGVPIRSSNQGVVLIAKEHYYSGNVVYVDHGAGIVTSYSHLSKILVAAGDEVTRGQILGESGETGRVNGPHLHWTLFISGLKVNALDILR